MVTSPAGSGPRHAIGGRTGFFVFVLAALLAALLLVTGCTPSLRIIARPLVSSPEPSAAGSPEPCDAPDVDDQVVQAAWAYVHARYPAQPWPDDVYLPQDWTVIMASKRYLTHVVLCSHATGFVWEGEVAWHVPCACCRVDIDGIRESFVTILAQTATSPPR
jgi:hypothetical protein